jgi:dtxA protein
VLEEIDQCKTGLTYEQMAREPKTYFATKGIFTGKVVIVKGDLFHTMRLAIGGDYKKMVRVDYVTEARSKNVLEDDTITVYGTFEGGNSYTSTSGAKIILP